MRVGRTSPCNREVLPIAPDASCGTLSVWQRTYTDNDKPAGDNHEPGATQTFSQASVSAADGTAVMLRQRACRAERHDLGTRGGPSASTCIRCQIYPTRAHR